MVELVVTIAIIITLTALLFPAGSRLIASSRQVACGSNLREIGKAMLMFAADNNNCYSPQVYKRPDTLWFSMYSPYVHNKNIARNKPGVRSAWLCPADNRIDPTGNNTPAISYGMNNSASDYTVPKPAEEMNKLIPLTTLKGPRSNLIFLADSGQNLNYSQPAIGWSQSGAVHGSCVEYRHMGKKRDQTKSYIAGEAAQQRGYANFLFFDGHVQALRDDQLTKELFSGPPSS